MKKLFILTLAFVMASTAYTGAIAATIGTDLTPDTSGGAAPYLLAKWEANVDKYTDDSENSGAQFNPTGVKNMNRRIAICTIVSDPDGVADVNHVYADVYYPVDIAVGASHYKLDSQTGSDTAGCGVLMQEDELTVLSKTDGINTFCNMVRNQNTNLPTFASGYDYDPICRADGVLEKETAKVYCVEKDLSYEDPAGDYRVKAVVVDKNGGTGTLENYFQYLSLTAFETDFTNIAYGNVRLETEKIINGNLTWNTPAGANNASVRNIGNTRLAMTVRQDDMNFGKTGMDWNVSYKARVGNLEGDWTSYDPEETVTLADELDLSEMDEMDFGIYVKKFPDDVTCYSGDMTLGAVSRPHLCCNDGTGYRCRQD